MALEGVGAPSSGAGLGGGPIDPATRLMDACREQGRLDVQKLAAALDAQTAANPVQGSTLRSQIDGHLTPVERGELTAAQTGSQGSGSEGIDALIDGAVRGDFSSGNSWSKVAGQTAVGFVPVIGQIADARDTIAALGQVGRGESGAWTNLAAAAIGWVPGIGDAAKGAIRGGVHAAEAGTSAAAKIVSHGDDVARALDRSLIPEQRAQHILQGDKTGGGHLHPGGPGKSPFPAGWSGDRILDEVNRIAKDASIPSTVQRNGRIVKDVDVDGVMVRVVQEPASKGGTVVTAFPTNTPRNP